MTSRRTVLTTLLAVVVTACGGAPLASVGNRSSEWINEPKVTTTMRPNVEAPRFTESEDLRWFNDDIESASLVSGSDRDAVIAEVFGRREGDRFVQASRYEIVAVVPEVEFPLKVPYGAEWVSSQLVVESNGRLSGEPVVAFGVWSAVPYTRSRSVAQMVILTVSNDPVAAEELSRPESTATCGRFAENETDECVILRIDGKDVWKLISSGGNTLIWFSGVFRYELFGRAFVPADVLEEMVTEFTPLTEQIEPSVGA